MIWVISRKRVLAPRAIWGLRPHPSLFLIALFALLFFAPPVWSMDPPASESAAADEQLRFGKITIELKDIFENPTNMVYRTANELKMSTRESLIRQELFFEEGEPYDQFRVLESERVLRTLRFLRDVSIREERRGSVVDIVVEAQDTWTLIPQVSFSSGDGRSRRSIGLAESNLLGYGKRLEALYEEDDGSDTVQAVYDSRNFWGTDNQLLLAGFDGNEGTQYLFEYELPYRALVQPTAWNTNISGGDTLGRLFQNGDERFVYQRDFEEYGARFSFARGEPEVRVQRFSFGYQYSDERFALATEEDLEGLDIDPASVSRDPTLVAEDRRFSGPIFSYDSIEQEFIPMNYIDRFERVEDYNLGREFSATLFPSLAALGAREDYLLTSANISEGYRFSEGSFITGEFGVGTRLGDNGFENTLFRTEARYFNVLGPLYWNDWYLGKHTLVGSFIFDYGDRFDRDRELLLGADNFLRGYDARTFTGDKRFALNLEERAHFIENAFDLISIGGAAFIDVGGATSDTIGDLFADELYSNVGVGLRLAFPKSSGERVVRIDFAVPLRDGPDGSSQFQLRVIFAGGQLFPARLTTDRAGNERAQVELGF